MTKLHYTTCVVYLKLSQVHQLQITRLKTENGSKEWHNGTQLASILIDHYVYWMCNASTFHRFEFWNKKMLRNIWNRTTANQSYSNIQRLTIWYATEIHPKGLRSINNCINFSRTPPLWETNFRMQIKPTLVNDRLNQQLV